MAKYKGTTIKWQTRRKYLYHIWQRINFSKKLQQFDKQNKPKGKKKRKKKGQGIEEMQINEKYMKRCSTPLVGREMQIKEQFCQKLVIVNVQSWQHCKEIGILIYRFCWQGGGGGIWKAAQSSGKIYGKMLLNFKNHTSFNQGISLLVFIQLN